VRFCGSQRPPQNPLFTASGRLRRGFAVPQTAPYTNSTVRKWVEQEMQGS
jgi:hypothetical protein